MPNRKLSVATASLAMLCFAAPVGVASAATTSAAAPAAPASAPAAGSPLLTFVPPTVGPLSVSLGATIIGGKVISPGVNVSTSGTSLPAITWSPPTSWMHPY
jgi:hypothetical protein